MALMFFILILYIYFPNLYLIAVKEDSFIEYLQAIFYLIASAIGFRSAYLEFKKLQKLKCMILFFFSIGSFFIFGEEISWGQRIIGFTTPDLLKKMNTQQELTIHNIGFIEHHIRYVFYLICSYACFGWIFFKQFNAQLYAKYFYAVPEWETIVLFLPIAAFHFIQYHYFSNLPIPERYVIWPTIPAWRHQETFELFFSMGFFVVAIRNFYLCKTDCPE